MKGLLASTLAALAIAGLVAIPAQAEESEWMLGGETLSELSLEEEEVSVSDTPVTIAVPSLEIKIECKKDKASGKIFKGGSSEVTGELTKCEIPKASSCKVTEPLVVQTKAELIYAGGVYYDKFGLAKGKSSLATVVLSGEKCGLPKETKLSGSFAAQLSLEDSESLPEKFSEATTKSVNKALSEEKEAELKLTFGEATAYMEGEFTLVPPLPPGLMRRLPKTKLCAVQVRTCLPEDTFGMGESVETTNVGGAYFAFEGKEIACMASSFGAVIGVPSTQVGISIPEFRAEECDGGCTIEPTAPGGEFLTSGGPGNGRLFMDSPKIELNCGETFCVYGRDTIVFFVTGGMPATFKANPGVNLTKKAGSDEGCANGAKWYGPMGGGMTYNATMPNPLYVTG